MEKLEKLSIREIQQFLESLQIEPLYETFPDLGVTPGTYRQPNTEKTQIFSWDPATREYKKVQELDKSFKGIFKFLKGGKTQGGKYIGVLESSLALLNHNFEVLQAREVGKIESVFRLPDVLCVLVTDYILLIDSQLKMRKKIFDQDNEGFFPFWVSGKLWQATICPSETDDYGELHLCDIEGKEGFKTSIPGFLCAHFPNENIFVTKGDGAIHVSMILEKEEKRLQKLEKVYFDELGEATKFRDDFLLFRGEDSIEAWKLNPPESGSQVFSFFQLLGLGDYIDVLSQELIATRSCSRIFLWRYSSGVFRKFQTLEITSRRPVNPLEYPRSPLTLEMPLPEAVKDIVADFCRV